MTATVTGAGTAADPWIISGTGFTVTSVDDSSLTATGAKSTLAAVPSGAQQIVEQQQHRRVHDPDDGE